MSTATATAVGPADTVITENPDGSQTIRATDAETGAITTIVTQSDRPNAAQSGTAANDVWLGALAILLPVLIIAAIGLSKFARTRMLARHGYPVREGRGFIEPAGGGPDAKRANELLAADNERLRAQVARLEERVAVMERIVTDPARRVAAEIDALR